MNVIRWEPPPPPAKNNVFPRKRRPSDRWDTLAAELRGRPGEWAVVAESGHHGSVAGISSTISGGTVESFAPRGSFEAVSRKVGDITTAYARYIGEGGAS